MERSAYAFATGLFVIALGLGLLAAARWLQGPEVERRPYQVVAKSSVAGLSPYSKVYYRGVEVGQVTAIRFARDGSRDILIDVALEPRVPVTVNTYAVLKSQGLTGLAFIELLDDGPLDAPELQTSGTDPGRIEMRPSLLESFQTVGQGIAEQIQQLAGNLNRLLAPESVARVGRILANLEDISARVDELLGLSRPAFTRLAPLLDQGDATLAEAATTLRALRDTLELLQARLRDAEAIAARADAAVAGVGEQMNSGILPELEAALAAIRAAADRFERLAATLENNPPALLLGAPRPPPGPGEAGYPGD
jgi:phospholipid/cholesterol/gamma-HCH transport system substrate-binding protein